MLHVSCYSTCTYRNDFLCGGKKRSLAVRIYAQGGNRLLHSPSVHFNKQSLIVSLPFSYSEPPYLCTVKREKDLMQPFKMVTLSVFHALSHSFEVSHKSISSSEQQ